MPRLVKPNLTEEEKKSIAKAKENLKKWMESPEFVKEMEESMGKAQKTIDAMDEAMKIDWKTLQEPFTI